MTDFRFGAGSIIPAPESKIYDFVVEIIFEDGSKAYFAAYPQYAKSDPYQHKPKMWNLIQDDNIIPEEIRGIKFELSKAK